MLACENSSILGNRARPFDICVLRVSNISSLSTSFPDHLLTYTGDVTLCFFL